MKSMLQNDIILDYQSGDSIATLIKKYHKTRKTIKKILALNKISIRSLSDQLSTHTLSKAFFSKLTDIPAYWFGYLLADGSVRSHRRKNGHSDKWLRIRISVKDKQHLELFKQHLNSDHPIKPEPKTKSIRLQIQSSELVNDLLKHGYHKFKNGVWLQSFNNPHIIRGLIDGDGWISKSKSGQLILGFCSAYRRHVLNVRRFLKLKSKIVFRKGVWRFDKNVTNYPSIYKILAISEPALARKWLKYKAIL